MGTVNNIIAAVDASPMGDEVLKRAILVAKEASAQMVVLHSIDIPLVEKPFGLIDKVEVIREKIEAKVEALNAEAKVDFIITVTRGNPVDGIIYEADKLQSDLIIIGSHGKEDITDKFFGSTVSKVVQRSHLPVLIVKKAVSDGYRNGLALTDLSEASRKSILFAKELFKGTDIKLAYAYEIVGELEFNFYNVDIAEKEEYRKRIYASAKDDLEKFRKSVGLENAKMVEGMPISESLLKLTKKEGSDLVILGSHGVKAPGSIIYGSKSSYLMKEVSSDVLIYVPLEK